MLKVLDVFYLNYKVHSIMFLKDVSIKRRQEIYEEYSKLNRKCNKEFNLSIKSECVVFELDLPIKILNFDIKSSDELVGLRKSTKIVNEQVSCQILKNLMPDININAKSLNEHITVDVDNWVSYDGDFLCQFKPLYEELSTERWSFTDGIASWHFEKQIGILTPNYVRHRNVTLSETFYMNKITGECTKTQFHISNNKYIRTCSVYNYGLRYWKVLEEDEIYDVLAVKR